METPCPRHAEFRVACTTPRDHPLQEMLCARQPASLPKEAFRGRMSFPVSRPPWETAHGLSYHRYWERTKTLFRYRGRGGRPLTSARARVPCSHFTFFRL